MNSRDKYENYRKQKLLLKLQPLSYMEWTMYEYGTIYKVKND